MNSTQEVSGPNHDRILGKPRPSHKLARVRAVGKAGEFLISIHHSMYLHLNTGIFYFRYCFHASGGISEA